MTPPPSQGTGCFSEPWTVQAAKEEKIMIIIIIIITVKSMLTGHSQNPLYGQNN